jgi:hypothetical protein
MKMKVRISMLTVVLFVCPLSAQEALTTYKSLEFTLKGAFNWGAVDGFMQTPAGGEPGTSSTRRPTFEELNIDDVAFYDAGLKIQWHQLGFLGGYQFIRFDQSGVLSQPLISRGVSFAAGDRFKTKDDFDWYHVGAGWRFSLLGDRLELFPKVEGAVLDFSYKLSSPSESVSRSYTKACLRLGVEGTYHLSQRLSLNLEGAASIPISNTPQIATVMATVNYKLLRKRAALDPTVFVGVGAEWIDYEDNQKQSNHVRLELGPFVTAGFSLSF